MLGNNHRYKREYSESEVEDMVIGEIQDNYDFDDADCVQDEEDYGDLEYDTDDLEQETNMGDNSLGFDKNLEPTLCKDSALGLESKRGDSSMDNNENHSSESTKKNDKQENRILFGAIYEIKPSIKYSIVGGRIYIYFNPLVYSPSKDEIERAVTILSLKQRCSGCDVARFYAGEFTVFYNPTIHSDDHIMVCVKFIAGVIERNKLNA